MIEQERKRAYNERTLQTDHGTFIPLVFSIKDNMGKECQKFYSRLAQLISENRDLPQSIWSNWIREKDCFGLVRSNLLCLRGLRTVCRETAEGAIQKGYPHIFSDFWHPPIHTCPDTCLNPPLSPCPYRHKLWIWYGTFQQNSDSKYPSPPPLPLYKHQESKLQV